MGKGAMPGKGGEGKGAMPGKGNMWTSPKGSKSGPKGPKGSKGGPKGPKGSKGGPKGPQGGWNSSWRDLKGSKGGPNVGPGQRIAGNNAKQTGNTARKDNVETMDEWMDGCEVRPGHRDIIGSKPHSLVGAVAPPVARLASPTRQAPSIHPFWQMAFRRVTKRRWWIHCAVTAVPHQISYGQTAVFDRGAIQAYQSRQCQQGSGRGSVQSERRCDSHPFSLCMVECGAAVHLSGSARSRQWTGHVTRYATHSSNELGRAGRAEQHHCPFGSLIIIIICCWKT